jgi:hypothetical protein
MKKLVQLVGILMLLFLYHPGLAQTQIHTDDIQNFYKAFDQVHQVKDRNQQLSIIETHYIGRGSKGLKTFIKWNGSNAERWLFYMLHHKAYLLKIRPSLEGIHHQIPLIQEKLSEIKAQYPPFKDGNIYFIMGIGLIGGSADHETKSLLLFAENLNKDQSDWAIPSAIHEFIHIQQKKANGQLLSQVLMEGIAEFMSELFYGKDLGESGFAPHINYGRKYEKQIWDRFKKEMFVVNNGFLGWLYLGMKKIGEEEKADLGYFMGYQISKAYYNNAKDKKQAIKELLELDLSSNEAVLNMILQSGYASRLEVDTLKKMTFIERKNENSQKKVTYGYKSTKDSIVFHFQLPKDFMQRNKVPMVYTSVAGTFNKWNPNDPIYKMHKEENNMFTLSIPKNAIKGVHTFKFVLNGDIWMPTPDYALNVDKEGNLTLVIK